MATDIQIVFRNKTYNVTEGLTAEDYVDSLRATIPGAGNAQLIDDGIKNGLQVYTLKEMKGTHG